MSRRARCAAVGTSAWSARRVVQRRGGVNGSAVDALDVKSGEASPSCDGQILI
jgi:hypothetical protein